MSESAPAPPERRARIRKRFRKAEAAGGKNPVLVPVPLANFDPYLSMQQQRLIGRVITVFARLEGLVQTVIWQLLGIGIEDGRIITCRNDLSANLTVLQSLARRKLPGDALERFLKLVAKAADCQQDRNFIVHGAWGTGTLDGSRWSEPAAASIRKKTDPERVLIESFPAERMLRIVADILATHQGLREIGDAFVASRDKPPPQSHEDSHSPGGDP